MIKSNLSRIFLVALTGGIIVLLSASAKGFEGLRTGIVDGMASKHWSTTNGVTHTSRTSSARLWWWPEHQLLFRPYYYEVDGKAYNGSNYDVQGQFVGSKADIERHYKNYPPPEITVYYNPQNPSQAVLQPGIALDQETKLYITLGAIGFLMTPMGG
jgi:hypothetical protein